MRPPPSHHFDSFAPYQPVTIQFQTLLIGLSAYFSTFAHATNPLSVLDTCLGLEVDPPNFTPDYQPVLLALLPSSIVYLRDSHSLSYDVPVDFGSDKGWLQHPHLSNITAGYSVCPVRLSVVLLTGSQLVSLPAVTKILQLTAYSSIPGRTDIFGSMLACSSPKLFAACHVCSKSKPGHPLNGLLELSHSYLLLRVLHSNLYSHDFMKSVTYASHNV